MALPLVSPFLQAGLPTGVDAENHFHRIISILVNWQNGYLWPRWTPYLYDQFGYPLHNFHPAGTYLVQALIYTITHADILSIFKGTQIVILLLYPVGAYLFARTFTGRAGALVAAAAYLYAPFRYRELWVQQDIPQFAAMLMLPWLLWAMTRGASRRQIGWSVAIGVCLAALILFHHSTTFLAVPLIVGYALLLIAESWWRGDRAVSLQSAGIVIGGLGLGALFATVYWLPALMELPFLQIKNIKDASYLVSSNFVPIGRLLLPIVPVDRASVNWRNFNDTDGARIGLVQLIAAGAGLLAWLPTFHVSSRIRWRVAAAAAGIIVCIFMITPQSATLWTVIPFASEIQYPWRILGDIAVLIIPGAAALPCFFRKRWQPWVAAILIGAFFVSTLPLLYAPLDFASIAPPTPATENTHEITGNSAGTTTANEYLPRWVLTIPHFGFSSSTLQSQDSAALQTLGWHVWPDDTSLPPGATIATLTPASLGTSLYQIEAPAAFTLYFHQFYFPGWDVQIDGQAASLAPSVPDGLITTPLAAGTHTVSIRYGGTTVQHASDALSMAAVLCAIILLAVELILKRLWSARPLEDESHGASLRPRHTGRPVRRLSQGVMLASGIFVLINQAILLPDTSLFRPHSPPGVTPASIKTHITFNHAVTLLGYDISASTLTPGVPIHIRLYWQALQKTHDPLQASLTLTNLDGQQAWAQSTSYGLDPRQWPLITSYATDDHTIVLPPGVPPFAVALRVSMFAQQSNPIAYYKTDDNRTDAVLTTLPVTGDYKTVPDHEIIPLNVSFNGQYGLIGYRFSEGTTPGQTCLTLRWQAQQAYGTLPLQVMIHLLGPADTLLGTADAPPLNGQDPFPMWLPGQILDDTHCFALPAALQTAAIALYTLPAAQRLPITASQNAIVKDQTVLLPFPG